MSILSELRQGLHELQIDLEGKLETFDTYTKEEQHRTLARWVKEVRELKWLVAEQYNVE